MPKRIRVVSCDYDGCLCHHGYYYATGPAKDIVKLNRVFNETLQAHAASFARTIFIIGSNRQSKGIDDTGQMMLRGAGTTGSCFEAIKTLSEYHKATFDPFLMADIYGNLPNGESFRRAIDPDYKDPHAGCIVDASKLTLLYAQIHKLANENPDKRISFEFYDDKLEITEGLFAYFKTHPTLIPANLDLCIRIYAGVMVSSMPTLRGQGFIDSHYKETVIEMTKMAEEPRPPSIPEDVLLPINGIRNVNPEKLTMPYPLSVDLSFMDTLQLATLELSDDDPTPKADVPFKLERQMSVEYVASTTLFGQRPFVKGDNPSNSVLSPGLIASGK